MASNISREEKIIQLQKNIEDCKRKIESSVNFEEELKKKEKESFHRLESCTYEDKDKIEAEMKGTCTLLRNAATTSEREQKNLKRNEHELELLSNNVRPRPMLRSGQKYFSMCNGQCKGVKCTFAHNDVELKEWNAQLSKENFKTTIHEVVVKKKKVNLRVIRMNILGLPRSGKTTFLKRLMGLILNIKESIDGEPNKEEPSTGIAERPHPIFVTNMGVIDDDVDNEWSISTSRKQQAKIIAQILYLLSEESYSDSSSTKEATSVKECMITTKQPNIDESKIDDIADVYHNVMDHHDWEDLKNFLDNPTLLISTDTGGQTEFLEIMSRFMLGAPSLNLIFTKLNNSLTDTYQVYSTNALGYSEKKECSDRTVMDVLLQALTSVKCLGNSDANDSYALFVGTFRDEVTDKEFKSIDECLQQKVVETDFHPFVEFSDEEQMIFPVNNYSGTKQEMGKIKRTFLKFMKSHFEEVEIPAHWLMLNARIQSEPTPLISLKKCKHLADDLLIKNDELKDALMFLHESVGAILYYPKLSHFFEDNIICDTKVIFDATTNLIKNTFVSGKSMHYAMKKFKTKAQFSLKDLRPASKDNVPIKELVKLLEYHKILMKLPTSSSNPEQTEYFMPCALRSASPKELEQLHSCDVVPPLMVLYDCGFVPLGVFCTVVISLAFDSSDDWELMDDTLFRNMVQFSVGLATVTLIGEPTSLMVVIGKNPQLSIEDISVICQKVRVKFRSKLEEVAVDLKYSIKFEFGFTCCCEIKEKHLCVKKKEYLRCLKSKKIFQFKRNQRLWFKIPPSQVGGQNLNSSNLLLIKWIHDKEPQPMKLRLRQTLASRWSNVAKLIGLSDSKIANIQKNNRDVEDCIDEVMKCWIEDAPNLSCYKCTWDGMCKLLVDLELSSQSEVLKEAIKAEQSTLRGNFTEGPFTDEVALSMQTE